MYLVTVEASVINPQLHFLKFGSNITYKFLSQKTNSPHKIRQNLDHLFQTKTDIIMFNSYHSGESQAPDFILRGANIEFDVEFEICLVARETF